jgi:hypothetical protein
VILLALAAILPGVFWDGPPDTAPALREAGVVRIAVPAERAREWKGVDGITADTFDLQKAVKVLTPSVNYRYDQASASRAPWINSNAWRFLRQPRGDFYYDAPGVPAALAAAEAIAWGVPARVKTDAAGLKPLGQMLAFARALEAADLQPVADFGFIDDGSSTSGEVMNLLARDNLLYRLVRGPETGLKLVVRLGSSNYPLEKAKNPAAMAQIVRGDLTDDRRSLRLFGSAVVVGRLETAPGRLRLHLINYDGASRKVNGLRVRVLGEYAKHHLASAGSPDATLQDFAMLQGATEFTLPDLKTYAVIDLSR